MTGVGMMLVGGGPYGAVTAPLACSIEFTGGSGIINVSGASGNMYTQFGSVISVLISGGTAPYGGAGTSLAGDASGKLSFGPSGDNFHDTILWSGLALNEVEYCTLALNVTDAAGATARSTYPSAGSIVIKRTS